MAALKGSSGERIRPTGLEEGLFMVVGCVGPAHPSGLAKAKVALMQSRASTARLHVSEIDPMSAVYPVSVYRRIEKAVSECIKSLRKIHGRFVVATKRTLQHEFNNDGSLIPVSVRKVGRRLDEFRPRD